MASWKFVLADSTGRPIGEVQNAANRTVTIPLNQLATASFTMRLDDPLAPAVMAGTSPVYVKAYRSVAGQPVNMKFHGVIVSAQEAANRDTTTIQVNAVQGWRLMRALGGNTLNGGTQSAGVILASAVPDASTVSATDIDALTGPYTTTASMTNYQQQAQTLLDLFLDISVASGIDWRLVPLETWYLGSAIAPGLGTTPWTVRLEAYDRIGIPQPNAVFEWGGRGNISSYTRSMDRTTQANRVEAYSNTLNYRASATDAVSQGIWGALADSVSVDLATTALYDSLVAEHVAVRKDPRQILSFTPHIDPYDSGRVPIFDVDYGVGDTVTARARFNGALLFDLQTRVWGASFAIDAQGTEVTTLQLVQ